MLCGKEQFVEAATVTRKPALTTWLTAVIGLSNMKLLFISVQGC
jgi:hypothetical protein